MSAEMSAEMAAEMATKMSPERQFGFLLKGWFYSTQTTQAELAKSMGVSAVTMSSWARGETIPSFDRLKKLSAHTGLPLAELVAPFEPKKEEVEA